MRKISCLVLALLAFAVTLQAQEKERDREDRTIRASIVSIAEDSRSMQVRQTKGASENLTLNLTATTRVLLDGENGKLADLRRGDRIEATVQRTDRANTYDCTQIRRNKGDQ